MPIQRSSIQTKMTLEEFYQDLVKGTNNQYVEIAHNMIAFLCMVNDLFKDTQLWGLTSHARLCILSEDNAISEWYVIISNIGTQEYYFQYDIPKDKQPWENATIHGMAKSLEEAKKYLLIAMRECEGWKGNEELERLLIEHELT